ncbi:hypothetical protein IMCC1933_26260 [Rhodobacteraceae bacterium IMCC1933]|nr:hypothetical protein [Rhodobacteraceae bacterium IMCC1923]MDP4069063.1 hypothetical protein [Rhodobacteraceae bacterium IMCC1933]MDP4069563.1 hypothetical protein [Rhodobacteraceae bacterium IMCC1909]
MTNKRPKPEEIVSKLRKVEVLMGQVTPAKFFIFCFLKLVLLLRSVYCEVELIYRLIE